MTSESASRTSRIDVRHLDWTALLVLAVALGAHLPALTGSWWCLDDWGLLARGLGLLPPPDFLPARWFSQHLYWQATVPLLGLHPLPHALLRGLIHAVSAVTVRSLGRRLGVPPLSALIAALLFAASPLVFTPLYWAAGVQELLGACCGLLALDRFCRDGTANAVWATLWAALSILAKEAGLGLPLIFLGILLWRPGSRTRPRVVGTACLAVLAGGEAALVLRHFATGPGDPYAMGGGLQVLYNLGMYCWWLLTPGSEFTSRMPWSRSLLGLGAFALWVAAALWSRRRGRRLPLAAVACFLVSLAPGLVLVRQTHPYLLTLPAVPFYLCLGLLVPGRWRAGPRTALLLGLVATGWGLATTSLRIADRLPTGPPADPVVRATALSREAMDQIQAAVERAAAEPSRDLVLLQPPITPAQAQAATELGPGHVVVSPRQAALGAGLGPRVMLPGRPPVHWVNTPLGLPARSLILAETGAGFLDWGDLRTGLLNLAVTDVALGHFERARRHFAAVLADEGDLGGYRPDPASGVPVAAARDNWPSFAAFLAAASPSDAAAACPADRIAPLFLP